MFCSYFIITIKSHIVNNMIANDPGTRAPGHDADFEC